MSLSMCVRMELKKIKHSNISFLLCIPILLVWGMAIMNASMNFEMSAEGISPQHNFYIQSFLSFVWFMLPASFVVITVMLNQIECANNGIQKMLSLPLSTSKLCVSKCIVMLLLLFMEMLLMLLGYIVSTYIVSKSYDYPFLLNLYEVAKAIGILYLLSLPMAAVYWMISLCFHQPIVSVGIGLASIIPILIFVNLPTWYVYPMCYPMIFLISQQHQFAMHLGSFSVDWLSALPFMLLITVACFLISLHLFGRKERS